MLRRSTLASRPLIDGHAQHLAGDFPRREVSLQSQQRGEAEPAIHRAADLGGDAHGGSFAFRHPHGLHRFPVREPEQVAARSVGGIEGAFDLRQSQRVLARELRSERLGQIGDAFELGDPAPVHGVIDLLRAELGLARAEQRFEVARPPYRQERRRRDYARSP